MSNLVEKVLSDGEYVISAIPVEMLDIIWPLVTEHLERVVEVSHGEITLESLYKDFTAVNSILLTISRGSDIIAVNTLSIRVFGSGIRALFIPVTGGNELEGWIDQFLDVAKSIAKEHDCTELRGIAVRRGWLKKLEPRGWETLHQIVRYELED